MEERLKKIFAVGPSMYGKISSLGLMLVAVVFAAAPGWVATGTEVHYSIVDNGGTGDMTFTVNSIEGNDIKMALLKMQGSRESTYRPTDAVDGATGQFWFDPNRLRGSLFAGQMISDWSIDETGTTEVADQEWETVTLSKAAEGATIQAIHDRETGIMLRREVLVSGSSIETVTFISINPSFGGIALDGHDEEPPVTVPAPNPTPSVTLPDSSATSAPSSAPVETPTTVNLPTIPPTTPPATPTTPATTAASSGASALPCLPALALFALVGSGFWFNKKN